MSKILYLEDEPFLGQVVVDSLQENSYEVVWVKSGKKALEAFEKELFDLCLLDVMVPDIDGFSVGKQIRDVNAKIPIVFITAKSQGADVVQGFDSGGTEYIKKPFGLDELHARLKNQLNLLNAVAAEKEEISFGKFTLDAQRLKLQFEGETLVKLTHRECEILKMLGAKLNETVERKHLLKQIWGDDSYYNSRNLDVYIKKIRDYLSVDSEVEIITLKGVGYKLVCA
ncbi:response regulator transcription factor [Luteibaculum oceani]|uniref:Response regulator transcription factor n=1 Tax=Luteibaculum oceani TaxID=1294296 RepID=A0A5C6UTK0_9FLAO|nr:response regulator transcription factor [Luteibaculum oceani]TXC75566.1 response regulator transcription factor [Luteibaculum oceani]